MNELSLFSGAGGGLLGTKLLGFRCVGYVERDPYCQAVLSARIADGFLDPAPIFGDIRQFVSGGWAARYRGLVDVVTAGFPCQPFSVAGKRLAHDDDRNLWPETARVLGVVRPRFALLENVPGLASHRYFGTVLGDLAALGFDAEWTVLGADDVGAPHRRKRLWILAHRERPRLEERPSEAGLRELEAAVGGGALSDTERDELWNKPGRIGGEDGTRSGEPRDDGEKGFMADATIHGRQPRRQSDGEEGERGRQSDRGSLGAEEMDDAGGYGGAPGLRQGSRRDEGSGDCDWWRVDPATLGPESKSFVGRVADGVANRVDRLKALGNGQVPAVVVRAWRELYARIERD